MPLIFSYGTLQEERVQLSTFGRLLHGQPDDDSRVSGTAFEITDAELAVADRYEHLAAYKRIAAILGSGKQAWVYVDARSVPGVS